MNEQYYKERKAYLKNLLDQQIINLKTSHTITLDEAIRIGQTKARIAELDLAKNATETGKWQSYNSSLKH